MQTRIIFYFLFFIFAFNSAYADYVPGEILVQFKPEVIGLSLQAFSAKPEAANIRISSIKALTKKFGITQFSKIHQQTLKARPDWVHLADYYRLTFAKEKNVPEVVEEFKKDPNVIQAQPNFIYRAFKTIPNDTYFSSGNQWGLTKIQAEDAWDITTGTSETIVAVLDTGVNYNHQDLQGKVLLGKDFVNSDDDPLDDNISNGGHGTSVAGVIGALTNNSLGIAALNWQTKILAVKILNAQGEGTTSIIDDALNWTRNYGAQIINMSFGTTEHDPFILDAINTATQEGKIMVAAAGNHDQETKTYPAAYDSVIAVAATDQNDQRAVWNSNLPAGSEDRASNYGTWVDISAPGSSIYSTHLPGNSKYGSSSGTSLACPFVSAVVGLIKAKYPSLTATEVRRLIEDNADNIDVQNSGYAGKLGKGRLNAYKALGALVAKITTPESGSYLTGVVEIKGTASGINFRKFTLEVGMAGSFETLVESITSVEGGTLASWNTTGKNGNYTLRLRVESTLPATQETTVSIIVDNRSPVAQITSPLNAATAEGEIIIQGTANDENLSHYFLEYGAGENPSSFELIGRFTSTAESRTLGSWETTGLSGIYTLRVRVFDKAGLSSSESITLNIAGVSVGAKIASLVLSGPNPFNPSSDIFHFSYQLSANFLTTAYLFDMAGNLIWQKSYSPGENGAKSGLNTPAWDGRDLYGNLVNNGVYLYQVIAERKVIGRGKLIVLR